MHACHLTCLHLPYLLLSTLQLAAAERAADQKRDAALAQLRSELSSGSEELQAQLEQERGKAAAAASAAATKEQELER